jgi:biopolymer transport protein ExbD
MLTTTWSRFNQMNVSLPSAAAQGSTEDTPSWVVVVSSQGTYAVNGAKIEGRTLQDLSAALAGLRKTDSALIIKADASASHQSVVNVLEAARMNGVVKIAFATQNSSQANKP